MSHKGVSIDQCIRLYFNQGLTQVLREITVCLSVRDNIQISTLHLMRRQARLKLHRQSHFSDAAGSDPDEPNLCDHEPHTRFPSRDGKSPDNRPVTMGKQALLSHDKKNDFFVILK